MFKFILKVMLVFFTGFLCFTSVSESASYKDGFKIGKKIKSKYFTIYLQSGVNEERVALDITLPSALKAGISQYDPRIDNYSLAGEMDLLFLAVSDILDINLSSFDGKIKICRDSYELTQVGRKLFGQSLHVGGFYVWQNNTLYLAADSIDINKLGHELSHAIQCNYFVVKPPVKLQEVLSGFVEYELRKYAR